MKKTMKKTIKKTMKKTMKGGNKYAEALHNALAEVEAEYMKLKESYNLEEYYNKLAQNAQSNPASRDYHEKYIKKKIKINQNKTPNNNSHIYASLNNNNNKSYKSQNTNTNNHEYVLLTGTTPTEPNRYTPKSPQEKKDLETLQKFSNKINELKTQTSNATRANQVHGITANIFKKVRKIKQDITKEQRRAQKRGRVSPNSTRDNTRSSRSSFSSKSSRSSSRSSIPEAFTTADFSHTQNSINNDNELKKFNKQFEEPTIMF